MVSILSENEKTFRICVKILCPRCRMDIIESMPERLPLKYLQ